MGGVGFHGSQLPPPQIIKILHQKRIAEEAFDRGDILDPVPFPKTVGAAKSGKPGFGGNSGTGKDDKACMIWHPRIEAKRERKGKS